MMSALAIVLTWLSLGARGETAMDLIKQAEAALTAGKKDDALALLDKALRLEPQSKSGLFLRAKVHEAKGQFAQALADLDQLVKLDPRQAEFVHERGCLHFKMSKFAESMTDFDKYLEMRPERKPSHWQRGITAYYAGKYDEGRKQFEYYQDFDAGDVENAVWRFMCMAKKDNLAKARDEMLKVGKDKRVPMKEIYDLFAGTKTEKDVMAAVDSGEPDAATRSRRLFYAHLYLGIYEDLSGNRKKALDHLNKATEDHRVGHYMWDVARVHRDLLKNTK